jgi:hypothetical protein
MNTLFDFISSVNGVEYVLAILFMLGFVLFAELLKPRPFNGLARAVAEDIAFMKAERDGKVLRLTKSVMIAPICALVYIAAVPLLFIHGVATLMGKVIAATTAVGWSPVQVYFANRKRMKKTVTRQIPD